MRWAAKFSGVCAVCGERIVPDDIIEWAEPQPPLGDGPRTIQHAVCPEPRPAAEVCPVCFMERSTAGTCGCP